MNRRTFLTATATGIAVAPHAALKKRTPKPHIVIGYNDFFWVFSHLILETPAQAKTLVCYFDSKVRTTDYFTAIIDQHTHILTIEVLESFTLRYIKHKKILHPFDGILRPGVSSNKFHFVL